MCWVFFISTQNPDYGNIKRSDNGDRVVISGVGGGGREGGWGGTHTPAIITKADEITLFV